MYDDSDADFDDDFNNYLDNDLYDDSDADFDDDFDNDFDKYLDNDLYADFGDDCDDDSDWDDRNEFAQSQMYLFSKSDIKD